MKPRNLDFEEEINHRVDVRGHSREREREREREKRETERVTVELPTEYTKKSISKIKSNSEIDEKRDRETRDQRDC